jgi:dynein heavy chain
MERGLEPNQLVPRLRATVDEYLQLLPVVSALRNAALRERHWAKVFGAIGTALPRDETFTLQVYVRVGRAHACHACQHDVCVCWACAGEHSACGTLGLLLWCAQTRTHTHKVLLDAGVCGAKDALLSISTEATQEAALEELLSKVSARWAGLELPVVPYKDAKDTYALGCLDGVQVHVSACRG